MLSAIRNLFDQQIAGRPDEPETTAEKRGQLAAAALLIEVVRSDERFTTNPRKHL